MAQAEYQVLASEAVAVAANDAVGAPLVVSVFADRAFLRDQIADDAQAAGLRVTQSANVSALLGLQQRGGPLTLGDIVLLDCPDAGAEQLAALLRLDMRARRSGAKLVVSTSVSTLDAIFGCLDQSDATILVDPSRAERIIALGGLLPGLPDSRLREMTEQDRLTLMRLTEQVGQIAEQMDRLDRTVASVGIGGGKSADGGAFRFASPNPAFRGPVDHTAGLIRTSRPPLPDPRLVRQVIAQRRMRDDFFDAKLFADPAWDILLDLTAARAEKLRVSVSSLCIAAAVPPTTGLRWVREMVEAGLLDRVADDTDKRRVFIALADKAAAAMAGYFARLEEKALTV